MVEFRIPEEISAFFDDEYGKILLVKGAPGSGKTVFALTLLSMLKGNGAYLATRVDPETMYKQHPWIKGEISAANIVDAAQSVRVQKTKEFTIKPLRYTDVPDFLKAIYARTESMEKPVIIIDSWDAVVSYTGYHAQKEREELEHSLCDFCRRTKTKILLLAENTEQTPLDYLADGVVVLESVMYDERRLRRMLLQKLRGCQIKNPVRLFSLDNGIFKSFIELKEEEEKEIAEPHPRAPIPDISDRRISTGIEDLDRVIGGYGTFNLFEGEYITYDIIARALSLNALNLGRSLLFMPWQEQIDRLMPFVEPKYRDNIEAVEDIKDLKDRIAGERRIIFINMEEIEDEEVVKAVIAKIRNRGDVVIGFTGADRGRGRFDFFASTHIRTMFISGVPCVCGEVPRTEIHALELDISTGNPEIRLTPIV